MWLVVTQRIFVALMAAAMFGFFVLPRALAAHNIALIAFAGAVILLYVAFNAWLLITRLTRARR